MMYIQENEETLPTGAEVWSEVTGKILICPTAGKKIANAYGYNNYLEGKGLGEIAEPTETMLSCDAEGTTGNLITAIDQIAARHAGGVIASYVDGHVVMTKGIVGYVAKDYSFTEDADFPVGFQVSKDVTSHDWNTTLFSTGTAIPAGTPETAIVKVEDGAMVMKATSDNYTQAFLTFDSPVSGDFGVEFDLVMATATSANFIGFIDESNKYMLNIGNINNDYYYPGTDAWAPAAILSQGMGHSGWKSFHTGGSAKLADGSPSNARPDIAVFYSETDVWHVSVARVNNDITFSAVKPGAELSAKLKSAGNDRMRNISAPVKGVCWQFSGNGKVQKISNFKLIR